MYSSLREIIKKTLLEKFENDNNTINQRLGLSKIQDSLTAFVENRTSNNLVEIKYDGNYSPLKYAESEFYKGSAEVYFYFENYHCSILCSFTIDNQNPSSNLITMEEFNLSNQQNPAEEVDGFNEFSQLDGNLAGQLNRKIEVLISQKINFDRG